MVIILQHSVYMLRQSPLSFDKRLRQGLESRGFKKSEYDDVSSQIGQKWSKFGWINAFFMQKIKY